MHKFVLELDSKEIQAVAQLLHLRLLTEGDHAVVRRALDSFSYQTNLVNKAEPSRHGVFPNGLTAPPHAVKFEGNFFVPVV